MSVTPYDLATHLGISDIVVDRAQMLINDALAQALAVVTVGDTTGGAGWENLPTGGDAVVRAAAGRQYLNASGVTTETVGPYSATRPAPTGAMFSTAEIATLERLAGRGGAFSVDTMPSDAGTQLPIWDLNVWLLDENADDLITGGEWSVVESED